MKRSWSYYLNLTKKREPKICNNCGCSWIDIAGINKRDWSSARTCSEVCAQQSRYKSRKARFESLGKKRLSEMGRAGGLASASKQMRRSKDEKQLFDFISNKWPNALHNHIITEGWDADIVIPNLQIAILWNGPWHYREMGHKNHSLLQVQTRDRIKTKKFEELGWTVKVFEDRTYTPQSAFEELLKELEAGELPDCSIPT